MNSRKLMLVFCGALLCWGGMGAAHAQDAVAAEVAAQGADCTAAQPFYWEIGDDTGTLLASGQVGGTAYNRNTVVRLASASKWIFGAYAAEVAGGVPASNIVNALNMQDGYNENFNPISCSLTWNVRRCHTTGSNDNVTSALVGDFFYGGGDGQYAAADLMGLGGKTSSALASEVKATLNLGSTFDYRNPGVSGGMEASAADYAGFLQKMMRGDYEMSFLLNYSPVRTVPCPTGFPDCSPIGGVDMEYSLHHWIENHTGGTLPNGVILGAGDGAFSSPGALGFYPWISSNKAYYGIISRDDGVGSFDESLVCGQAIRDAFLN